MRGYPDYSVPKTSLTGTGFDSNELAVRCGSISTFHRLGQVIYQSHFDNGLDGFYDASTSPGSVRIMTDKPYTGNGALCMTPGTGALQYAVGYRYTPFCQSSRYGIELLACMVKDAALTCSNWGFGCDVITASGLIKFEILVENYLNRIRIYSDTPSPASYYNLTTGLYDLSSLAASPVYHWFKLIYDTSTGRYVRLLFDNSAYNLSGYAGVSLATPGGQFTRSYLYTRNQVNAAPIYIDNYILTINEP